MGWAALIHNTQAVRRGRRPNCSPTVGGTVRPGPVLAYEGQLRVVRSPQGLGWGSCQVNTGTPVEPPVLLLVSGGRVYC